ncbi:MAG TPA: type II secretion system protein N [Casimicrobiaceae bacterium]
MRATIAIGAGALLLALALVITAPASLLDARLAALSGDRVRIADAEGTLWNGSGVLVLLPDGTRRPLVWHIAAWPLLRGEVRGTIAGQGDPTQRGEFSYGRERAELRAVDFALPMQTILASAGVPTALLAAGGVVTAHVERLIRTPEAIDARLTLQWRDATLPGLLPGDRIALGEVRLDVDAQGPEIAGALSNRGGEVEIAGRATVSAALAPKVDASVRPRAGLDRDRAEAIGASLSLIGSAEGQGGYRLRWPRS